MAEPDPPPDVTEQVKRDAVLSRLERNLKHLERAADFLFEGAVLVLVFGVFETLWTGNEHHRGVAWFVGIAGAVLSCYAVATVVDGARLRLEQIQKRTVRSQLTGAEMPRLSEGERDE